MKYHQSHTLETSNFEINIQKVNNLQCDWIIRKVHNRLGAGDLMIRSHMHFGWDGHPGCPVQVFNRDASGTNTLSRPFLVRNQGLAIFHKVIIMNQ